MLSALGDTSEHQDVLRPGAPETLDAVRAMADRAGVPVALGLVSEFDMPAHPDQIPVVCQSYYAILDNLGIRRYFEPVDRWVTLFTEVGEFKPQGTGISGRLGQGRAGPPVR